MFQWLARRRAGLKTGASAFDPYSLDDPVAEITGWGPASSGGSSARDRRLVSAGPLRLEYRSTKAWLALLSLIMLVPGGVCLLGLEPSGCGLVGFGVGVAMGIIGAAILYVATAPIVFDKDLGTFSKLWVAPFERQVALGVPRDLEDIHALQLISEYVVEDESRFYSFELNVVLRDGERLNIVDHFRLEPLREEARALAAFLGKPLWDAVQ